MKILFVLDELPYPPKNGVTIPAFNYLSRLALEEEVSSVTFDGECSEAE